MIIHANVGFSVPISLSIPPSHFLRSPPPKSHLHLGAGRCVSLSEEPKLSRVLVYSFLLLCIPPLVALFLLKDYALYDGVYKILDSEIIIKRCNTKQHAVWLLNYLECVMWRENWKGMLTIPLLSLDSEIISNFSLSIFMQCSHFYAKTCINPNKEKSRKCYTKDIQLTSLEVLQ